MSTKSIDRDSAIEAKRGALIVKTMRSKTHKETFFFPFYSLSLLFQSRKSYSGTGAVDFRQIIRKMLQRHLAVSIPRQFHF